MIEITDIMAYVIALGVAAAIPGPGITALVARSLGQGARSGFSMLGGLIVGDLVYLSFAVFGLSLMAQHFNVFFTAIRWGAIAYLLFLAWQFWKAKPVSINETQPTNTAVKAAALSGLAITLGNPKTIAFYLALLPLVIDLKNVNFFTYSAILAPLTVAVLIIIGGFFIISAVAVRSWLTSVRAQKNIYRGASVAMFGAAGTMVLREL